MQLLQQVARGDETAFATLFDLYHNKLGAYVLRLTDSHELAEEIVQDVFLKIWMNREAIPQIISFRNYLFVIARNHALNCLKQVAREYVGRRDWFRNTRAERSIYMVEEEQDIDKLYYPFIEEAILKLPPQQKKVYLLSRNEGLKYEEIAARLNLSFETVKKHMHLALQFIRRHVGMQKDMLLLIMAFFSLFY